MTTNTTERHDLSLGDMVVCNAYIKPSGRYFEIHNGAEPSAYLWEKGQTGGKEVDCFESCDKYETKTAVFTGVFVGVTLLCTELYCELYDHPYYGSKYQCSSEKPKPFAIVYYASNKKRLVPMDCIQKVIQEGVGT